jgi:hypothetical protein
VAPEAHNSLVTLRITLCPQFITVSITPLGDVGIQGFEVRPGHQELVVRAGKLWWNVVGKVEVANGIRNTDHDSSPCAEILAL